MLCGAVACGNSNAPAKEQSKTESTNTTEEVATTVDDTYKAVTRGGTQGEGFGRCCESGCYCKAFKGRGQTCQNCGHAYKSHY